MLPVFKMAGTTPGADNFQKLKKQWFVYMTQNRC